MYFILRPVFILEVNEKMGLYLSEGLINIYPRFGALTQGFGRNCIARLRNYLLSSHA